LPTVQQTVIGVTVQPAGNFKGELRIPAANQTYACFLACQERNIMEVKISVA
jgi:hypothetical protein